MVPHLAGGGRQELKFAKSNPHAFPHAMANHGIKDVVTGGVQVQGEGQLLQVVVSEGCPNGKLRIKLP